MSYWPFSSAKSTFNSAWKSNHFHRNIFKTHLVNKYSFYRFPFCMFLICCWTYMDCKWKKILNITCFQAATSFSFHIFQKNIFMRILFGDLELTIINVVNPHLCWCCLESHEWIIFAVHALFAVSINAWILNLLN